MSHAFPVTPSGAHNARPGMAAPFQRPQHLCIRPLTIYDSDQADRLEALGFDESERVSADKLKYRLTVCPELCSGLFLREFEDVGAELTEARNRHKADAAAGKTAAKKSDGAGDDPDYESGDELVLPPPRSTVKSETLIGHILATKIYDQKITERSMQIPKLTDDYLPDKSVAGNDKVGHVEGSRVIGIHSVVIHPKYRRLKLGSLLVKDYLQKMNQQCVADRVVLLAKDKLVPFYKGIEFVDDGVSACKYAGQEWHDLHCVLTHEEDDDDM